MTRSVVNPLLFWLTTLVAMAAQADCTLTSTGKIPLNDLGLGLYLGAAGGLYPGSANTVPAAHAAAGLAIAQQIQPLDANGTADPVAGRIVLMSVGMSNTTQEFATRGPGAFKPRADADPAKNPKLVIVDGAQGGQTAAQWMNPNANVWQVVQQRLTAAGVTAAQIQAVWVKLADRAADVPDDSFPANALFHQPRLEQVLRLLKQRYPNLRIAFMSSRTRAYTDVPNTLNPEPFAYEQSFSVKWLIQGQIQGSNQLNYDPALGPVVAPLVIWGPYLWIDGLNPRSDGRVWPCSDLVNDFVHPSEAGATKVGDQLLATFKSSPFSTPWFLRAEVIAMAPTAAIAVDSGGGAAPLTVQFTAIASDSDGSIASTSWDFADGTSSLAAAPVKTFPVPGRYRVRLVVTDDDGNHALATRIVRVGELLFADGFEG